MNGATSLETQNIKNFSPEELASVLDEMGFESYRSSQILSWLYNKNVTDWDAMTNLSKVRRAELAARFGLGVLKPAGVQVDSDGTRKYLFELHDGSKIESVLLSDERRVTLCVSTQVGCSLGCKFCYTGTLGFKRNLDASEIIEQVLAVKRDRPASEAPTNVVFMGMGEPLLNYDNVMRATRLFVMDNALNFSTRHITLSTAGIPDMIDRLAEDKAPLNLAISLNAPDDELRSRLMPVNKKYPLKEVFRNLENFPLPNRRRITFEYIMFRGVNDDELTAQKLANLIKRYPCKLNLIPFNPFPGCEFEPTPTKEIERFQDVLRAKHISVFLRKSRGADIMAACGQLIANSK